MDGWKNAAARSSGDGAGTYGGRVAPIMARTAPHADEAETAVLAGLLAGTCDADGIFAALPPEAFYAPARRAVYEAARDLWKRGVPVEPASVAGELRSRGAADEGPEADALGDAMDAGVLGAGADHYAGSVLAAWQLRQIADAGLAAASDAHACGMRPDMAGELLGRIEARIRAIGDAGAGSGAQGMADGMDATFRTLEADAERAEDVTGVPTGYDRLDLLTGGLQPTDMIVVAARPAVGKTAWALCLTLNAARAGRKVAFFSLEMSAEQLRRRMLAVMARVDVSRLRQPQFLQPWEWDALYAAGKRLRTLPITIVDRAGLRPSQMRAECRRLQHRGGLDLAIVDYLQYMRGDKASYYSPVAEVTDISKSLKMLAKELNIPVVALAQLNRKLEERDDKRPILSDLRESGAIEQDADLIAFLHREDVYRRFPDGLRPLDSIAELIVAKHRSGETASIPLLYRSPWTAYEALEPYWRPASEARTGFPD